MPASIASLLPTLSGNVCGILDSLSETKNWKKDLA